MATVRTLGKIQNTGGCKVADTAKLATLIEVQAGLNYLKNSLDMSELLPYLAPRLHKFKGVKKVILGCSHYLYCKPQITKCLGNVEFCDGNERLCASLAERVQSRPDMPAKITFDFTALNESKKYSAILKMLLNN